MVFPDVFLCLLLFRVFSYAPVVFSSVFLWVNESVMYIYHHLPDHFFEEMFDVITRHCGCSVFQGAANIAAVVSCGTSGTKCSSQ